jgi:integrase/recombinase XerD
MTTKEAQGRAEGTLLDYQHNLTRFTEYLEDPPYKSITNKKIEQYFQYLQDLTYARGKKSDLKLAPKTIKNAWIVLSTFFNWVELDLDIENPMKMPIPKANDKLIMPFTFDEIKSILKICDYSIYNFPDGHKEKRQRPTRWRDRALIHIMFDTGARVSEICNMVMSDLDMGNNRVHVTGKGKKDRYLFFSQETAQALWKYHLQVYPNQNPEPDDPVFLDRRNLYSVTRNSIRQLVGRLGDAAGVDNVHPHRFRHSFAVSFLKNGGDAFSLMDILGHTTLQMTRKYLHLAESDIKKIHKRASPISNMYKS